MTELFELQVGLKNNNILYFLYFKYKISQIYCRVETLNMAWLAHCNSNDELCDELCRLGVVGLEIRNVFKQVDRGIFTPQSIKHEAYRDTPLLSGRMHISGHLNGFSFLFL